MADSNRGPADYPQAAQWRGSNSRIVSHQSDSRRRSIQREDKMSEKLEGLEQALLDLYYAQKDICPDRHGSVGRICMGCVEKFIRTRIAAAEAAALEEACKAVCH